MCWIVNEETRRRLRCQVQASGISTNLSGRVDGGPSSPITYEKGAPCLAVFEIGKHKSKPTTNSLYPPLRTGRAPFDSLRSLRAGYQWCHYTLADNGFSRWGEPLPKNGAKAPPEFDLVRHG